MTYLSAVCRISNNMCVSVQSSPSPLIFPDGSDKYVVEIDSLDSDILGKYYVNGVFQSEPPAP